MSRRKCCCRLAGDVDPPPKPDDSKCTEPQLYTTESINYDFSDNCKPRFHDGFKNDSDFCNNALLLDQNGNQINDNYLGKHYSWLDTKDVAGVGAPSFYRNIGGGFGRATGLATGVRSNHYFHIDENNIRTIGYQLDGSIDVGFERFGRVDIDQIGWGNLFNQQTTETGFRYGSNSPYPKVNSMEITLSSLKGLGVLSYDYFDGANWSLGLPLNDAYYKTRIYIGEEEKLFNTPVIHYYNATPTFSFNFEIINIEYVLVENNIVPLGTIQVTVTGGGDSLTSTYIQYLGPCYRGNKMLSDSVGAKGVRVKGSDNTTGTNNYTTYPDALNLTGVYPDIAFCFSAMDNFIWQPTIV